MIKHWDRASQVGRLGKAHKRMRGRAGEKPDEMAVSDPAFRGPALDRLGIPLPAPFPCSGKRLARSPRTCTKVLRIKSILQHRLATPKLLKNP